ncbi:MAG: glutamine synthetase beta-grasp domain-containing protein [Alphaproteobacteria bacterium]
MNTYRLSFKGSSDLLKYIEEQNVQFVDLNFTPLSGKWQRLTLHASAINKKAIENGVFTDNKGDGLQNILIKPDISRVSYDPFAAQKTIKIFCDLYAPDAGKPHLLATRSVARRAQAYLKESGVGDNVFYGSDIQFFVFDSVKVINTPNQIGYHLDSEEGAYNKARDYPTGNMGHRPDIGSGLLSEGPVDSLSDIRAEMLSVIESMGVAVDLHHHGAAAGQCVLGLRADTLLSAADNIQICKHVAHNVAHSYGKSATFMPRPLNDGSGSAMHIKQSLWNNGRPLFSGNEYANLSDTAMYYIGGILKHIRALNAFGNPTTNSYKRLNATGAPILPAYSQRNDASACYIPPAQSADERRINLYFPDPAANPYLLFSATLMAGLDGVKNKIHPGSAIDDDPALSEEDKSALSSRMCTSLDAALDDLQADHAFLLQGHVFTKELIDAYVLLKKKEVKTFESMTHPIEIDMYYSS